jgi:hypothetical protein
MVCFFNLHQFGCEHPRLQNRRRSYILLPLIKDAPEQSETLYQLKNKFETVIIEDDSIIGLLILTPFH